MLWLHSDWYSEEREREIFTQLETENETDHGTRSRSGAGWENHFLILNSSTSRALSAPALSALFINILRGRGISGFMDYRVLCSKHKTRKCTDIILKLALFFLTEEAVC